MYNGTGGTCNVHVSVCKYLFRLDHQAESFPLTTDSCDAGAQKCADKGRESMWLLTTENLHPAFQKNAGRKSPAELGMCQGRCCASTSQYLFPWHSQCSWGSMTGGRICSGWRNGLTGKKQSQPFGVLSWAFVYLPLWYLFTRYFIYQSRDGEKWLLFFNKPRKSHARKTLP